MFDSYIDQIGEWKKIEGQREINDIDDIKISFVLKGKKGSNTKYEYESAWWMKCI